MTVLFNGRVRVDHHQFYVESGDVSGTCTEAFESQVNALLGATVPGTLTLSVGTAMEDVGLRVVLLDAEPEEPDTSWEDVVEASFTPQGPELGLREPMDGPWHAFDLQVRDYRVRLSVRGIDDSWDLVVGPEEPLVDHYELTFWPAQPAPDAVLRLTSANAVAVHRALDPELVRADQIASWDGNPPSDALLDDSMVDWFLRLDRELAEEMLAAGPYVQRQLTYWAADRGCREAGIADIAWVAGGLRSLWADERLPKPFGEPTWTYQRLEDDPGNPRRAVTSRGHAGDAGATALSTLLGALDGPPLHAAMTTLSSLRAVVGDDRADDVWRWARTELRRLVALHGPGQLPDSRSPEAMGWSRPVTEFTVSGPDDGWFATGQLLSADDPSAQYLDPRPVAEQVAELVVEAPDVLHRVAALDPAGLRDTAFDLARHVCAISGLNELPWVNDAFLSYGQSSAPEPWSTGTEGSWLMSNPRVHERTTLHDGVPVPTWPFALRAVRNSLAVDAREAVLLVVHAGIRVGGDNRGNQFLEYVRHRLGL